MAEKRKRTLRRMVWMALAALLLFFVAVGVTYSQKLFSALFAVWVAALPLVLGCIIAFVINLVMSRFERLYFPESQNKIVQVSRRPVSLALSFAAIALVVAFIVYLVLPQIRASWDVLENGVVVVAQNIYTWVEENTDVLSAIVDTTWLDNISENFDGILSDPSNGDRTSGLWSLLGSLFSAVYSVAHGIFVGVVSLVFSVYLLLDKERVLGGVNAAIDLLLPENHAQALHHAAHVANESFSRFISGQCIEALILGTLCALGMTLFGIPYAAAVGACVGLTALVPLFGAWLGGIVGFLMVLTVDPVVAVWFVVFLIVLQQIETHLIYPNVVGASVGLPSIWVFSSVLVGGALFGVAGMFLGVPAVATVRTLVIEHAAKVRAEKEREGKQNPQFLSGSAEGEEPLNVAISTGISADSAVSEGCGAQVASHEGSAGDRDEKLHERS